MGDIFDEGSPVWRGHGRLLAQYLDPWIATFYPHGDTAPHLTLDDLTTHHDRLKSTPTSPDSSLAAFAQLGVLRLGFQRAFISLVGRRKQHVLAEATQTSALQSQTGYAEKEGLWIGRCVLPTSSTIEGQLMKEWLPYGPSDPTSNDEIKKGAHVHTGHGVRVIEDLSQQRNSELLAFTRAPYDARYYVASPIRSTSGKVIGVYALYDTAPHTLQGGDFDFLEHISRTVSSYLSSISTKLMQARGERLVRGLILFMEGKSSLRQWFVDEGFKDRLDLSTYSEGQGAAIAGEATNQYGPEHMTDQALDIRHISANPDKPIRLKPGDHATDRRVPQIKNQSTSERRKRKSTDMSSTARSSRVSSPHAMKSRRGAESNVESDVASGGESPNEDRDDHLITDDMSLLFSRASNLIREACGFDGVIMYDASDFESRKHQINGTTQKEKNRKYMEGLEADASDHDSQSDSSQVPAESSAVCNLLGFSVTTKSSLAGNLSSRSHRSLKDAFLQRLIRRFPRGKVFHFDQGEAISSSEEYRTDLDPEAATKFRGRRQKEYEQMQKIAGNDVNSVVFFPLWDWHRNRWFAGLFAWTTSSVRAIDAAEELQYLKAFGNSIMTELARIDVATADRAKAKFISSISHELRSPLHGILAGTELLESMDPQGFASSIISTIDSCGKTLLDTINNLLEYSGINSRSKGPSKIPDPTHRDCERKAIEPQSGNTSHATEVIDPSLVVEEVLETALIGLDPATGGFPGLKLDHGAEQQQKLCLRDFNRFPYMVYNFPYTTPEKYMLPSGIWKRILLNLISNAIKFTKTGYVTINLEIQDHQDLEVDSDADHLISFSIEDSGRGISGEFMRHRLYTPFVQEDILAPGTGLGLHLTRQMIEHYSGSIDCHSEVGQGTCFIVKLPVKKSHNAPPENYDDLRHSIPEQVRDRSICLMSSAENRGGATEALKMALSSLTNLFTEWFHMNVQRSSIVDEIKSDFVLMTDEEFQALQDDDPNLPGSKTKAQLQRVMVLCYNLKYGARAAQTFPDIQFIIPPFGTRSLSKALHNFLRNEKSSSEGSHSNSVTPNEEPEKQNQKNSATDRTTEEEARSPASFTSTSYFDRESHIDDTIMGSDRRLLLVEDNEINMKFLVAFAKKNKLQYDCAANGLEAVNSYKRRHGNYIIILMDISMPVMDGLAATRAIRRYELEEDLPVRSHIVALTGVASESAQQDAYNAGVDLFVSKPVSLKRLKEIIDDISDEDKRKEKATPPNRFSV